MITRSDDAPPTTRCEPKVRWGGKTWYPRGGYYTCEKTSLHRAIYEAAHGPIPAGHVIHHIDGDPNNNTTENLEALAHPDHQRRHTQMEAQPHNRFCCLRPPTHVRANGLEYEHICDTCGEFFFSSARDAPGATFRCPACRRAT